MAAKACKCKKKECEECPEWIFTFADLVMLMMGFFGILWVLKPDPGKKSNGAGDQNWIKVVGSIREAFGYVPNPNSKDPVDQQLIIKGLSPAQRKNPGDGGKTSQMKSPEGTDPEVTNIRPARQATEGGKMLFERGIATLSDETKKELTDIAQTVKGHRNIVMIKGHTSLDDLPDNATAEQKMDLSIRRAQAAEDYLVEQGVEPEILRVQGCSTFEPLIQREYTADSQTLNRRIEVEATATLSDDFMGSGSGGSRAPTPGQ